MSRPITFDSDKKDMKYKVGDKVKIIGNSCYHDFKIGNYVIINGIANPISGFDYVAELVGGSEEYYVVEQDITDPDSAFDRVGNKVPEEIKEKVKDNIKPNHYKAKTDVIEFCFQNNIGFAEMNVIKYITRWKDKNGLEDLKKRQKNT